MFGSYESFQSLTTRVDDHIADNRLNEALELIHHVVEAALDEPALVGVFLGSRRLDAQCREIGMLAEESLYSDNDIRSEEGAQSGCVIYIVTKLQVSGGHTKVIRDFIKARPLQRHVILSTELLGPSELKSVNSDFSTGPNVSFDVAVGSTHLQRLQWLLRELRARAPERVYLFNHHQDSVAVAAAICRCDVPIAFYHHGDHHLCLGVFLSGVQHIDPHPMGYCNCREKLKIDSRYVPLIVEDRLTTRSTFMENGFLTTCTAARLNKIEIPYYVDYTYVIPELLSKTGGRHVHVGHLTPWALHRIRRNLKKLRVDPTRFEYVPWVPSVWDTLVEKGVDLYVASFPYGGGLTLIEAMGAGVPVALHRHMYSPILSGLSLGYPGAFNWHRHDDLIQFCMALDREALLREGSNARRHYKRYHQAEVLAGCLADENSVPSMPDAAVDKQVQFDVEEWAQWISNSTSLGGVLRKKAIRTLKSIRSLVFIALHKISRFGNFMKGRRS